MASTITLAQTQAAVQPHVKYRPLAFPSLGSPVYEPLVTMANLVKLAILGPPFRWRWNRLSTPVTFTCTVGPADYPQTVANFGWIETAAVQDLGDSYSPHKWQQLTRLEGLALATEQGLPSFIAPQYDNGAGQITFRMMPSPDQAYPVTVDIQQKPSLFTQAALTGQTWGPIPDEYSHLYTWGVMALAMILSDDQRWVGMNQKFVGTLLSTHQGLSENEQNIFLSTWMALTGQMALLPARMQQGVQARGV